MRLTDFISKDQDLTNFIQKTSQVKNSLITGANAGAFSLLLKQIVLQKKVPLLLIEENENKAQNLYNELSGIMDDGLVQYFSVDSTLATQNAVASPDELSNRLQSLNFLLTGKAGIVVTTPQGLQYKLSPVKDFLLLKKNLLLTKNMI